LADFGQSLDNAISGVVEGYAITGTPPKIFGYVLNYLPTRKSMFKSSRLDSVGAIREVLIKK